MTQYITNDTVSFEGRTRECTTCEDGNNYNHTEECSVCKGNKTFPKNGRNYKCKNCKGNGYVFLKEKTLKGPCYNCKGTRIVPLTAYDQMTKEDKEWIFENLFNFEKPYEKSFSSFNEGYLGIRIIAGVTDYGRYKAMTPEEFKEEVKDNFMNGFKQYVTVIEEGKLPKEILIRKGESGWHAYGNF